MSSLLYVFVLYVSSHRCEARKLKEICATGQTLIADNSKSKLSPRWISYYNLYIFVQFIIAKYLKECEQLVPFNFETSISESYAL